jgi:MEDS: MEthanogen/methylotroph, DcmR Sensory domain
LLQRKTINNKRNIDYDNDDDNGNDSGYDNNCKPIIGDTARILQQTMHADYGAHYLILYPDLTTLRQTYSQYVKTSLVERNEIMIILPFYETVDGVRDVLTENCANIDIRACEKEQSLIIVDSLKGYSGSPEGIMPVLKQMVRYAKSSGKSGVSAFGDMGSFFYNNNENSLMEYELSLPSEYDSKMNLKTFCLYHQKEFDLKFTEKQKKQLLVHHGNNLALTPLIK